MPEFTQDLADRVLKNFPFNTFKELVGASPERSKEIIMELSRNFRSSVRNREAAEVVVHGTADILIRAKIAYARAREEYLQTLRSLVQASAIDAMEKTRKYFPSQEAKDGFLEYITDQAVRRILG